MQHFDSSENGDHFHPPEPADEHARIMGMLEREDFDDAAKAMRPGMTFTRDELSLATAELLVGALWLEGLRIDPSGAGWEVTVSMADHADEPIRFRPTGKGL